MVPDNVQKSNYDRWKPSTKLACVIELKKVSSSQDYFDASTQRFSPLTWHLVAEALNKEYPDFAKRFTNVNIKGRYDRVIKYHKVFKRMANPASGFTWNPCTFCFDHNDKISRQIDQGIINDEYLSNEINTVKLLHKPGHIDLEYFHRYIYRTFDQANISVDSIINSPSYIGLAIENGALTTASCRPDFFRDLCAPSINSSTQNSVSTIGTISSTSTTGINEVGSQYPNASSVNMAVPISCYQVQQPQQQPQPQPRPQPQPQQLSQILPHSQYTSQVSQQSRNQNQVPQHHLQSAIPLPMNPSHPQTPVIPQDPPVQPSASHSNSHQSPPIKHLSLVSAVAHPLPHIQSHQRDQMENFSMMDATTSMITSIPQQLGLLALNNIPNEHMEKKRKLTHSSDGLTVPPSSIGFPNPGLMYDPSSFEPSAQSLSASTQAAGGINQILPSEVVMHIHREIELLKYNVNEKLLELRINKLVSHRDFLDLQDLVERCVPFVRSAHERLADEAKLLELIQVYLGKDQLS